jgi:hypothetical protein
MLDRHVLAFDITGFVEAFAECGHIACGGIGRPDADKRDNRHRRLLCARREQPRHSRTAERSNEFPPAVLIAIGPSIGGHARWITNDSTPQYRGL